MIVFTLCTSSTALWIRWSINILGNFFLAIVMLKPWDLFLFCLYIDWYKATRSNENQRYCRNCFTWNVSIVQKHDSSIISIAIFILIRIILPSDQDCFHWKYQLQMSNEYLLYLCILYNTVHILCTSFQDDSVRIRIHHLIWIMFIHGKIETNSKIDIVWAGDRLNICFMDGGKVLFSSQNEFRGVGSW